MMASWPKRGAVMSINTKAIMATIAVGFFAVCYLLMGGYQGGSHAEEFTKTLIGVGLLFGAGALTALIESWRAPRAHG